MKLLKNLAKKLFPISLCLVFIFLSATCFLLEARTQKILNVRTKLRPVGLSNNQMFWFAPGAYWIDDFEGGVQSGTLDQEADLKIWNSKKQVRFGPGFIRFERSGGVKEGTLLDNTPLCIVNTASINKISLKFKGLTAVEFGYDGCVMKGTLAQKASLKFWNGKSNTYPPGTLIDFNGAGLVTKAILPPSGPTLQDGLYSGTCTIVGIDTFPFNFLAGNGVFNGSIEEIRYSLQWQGNYDNAGKIKNGRMTGWVDEGTGTSKTRWTVRGPIQGTIATAAAKGTLSITTADGLKKYTGNWKAAVGTPTIKPCNNYSGPIEPLRIPSAGASQTPGTYWLVWTDVPKTTAPKEKWNWKRYGPVTLKGSKRYFVVFGRNLPVTISEEKNLPIQETKVTATPGSAIIWDQNDSKNGARIAYCFQQYTGIANNKKSEIFITSDLVNKEKQIWRMNVEVKDSNDKLVSGGKIKFIASGGSFSPNSTVLEYEKSLIGGKTTKGWLGTDKKHHEIKIQYMKSEKIIKLPPELLELSTVFIIDASGSMRGKKLASAKASVRLMMAKYGNKSDKSEMALFAFFDCGKCSLLQSFTQNPADIVSKLGFSASGGTPIAYSLKIASNYLRKYGRGKKGRIILLSDGGESCRGNPVKAADSIHTKKLNFKLSGN